MARHPTRRSSSGPSMRWQSWRRNRRDAMKRGGRQSGRGATCGRVAKAADAGGPRMVESERTRPSCGASSQAWPRRPEGTTAPRRRHPMTAAQAAARAATSPTVSTERAADACSTPRRAGVAAPPAWPMSSSPCSHRHRPPRVRRHPHHHRRPRRGSHRHRCQRARSRRDDGRHHRHCHRCRLARHPQDGGRHRHHGCGYRHRRRQGGGRQTGYRHPLGRHNLPRPRRRRRCHPPARTAGTPWQGNGRCRASRRGCCCWHRAWQGRSRRSRARGVRVPDAGQPPRRTTPPRRPRRKSRQRSAPPATP